MDDQTARAIFEELCAIKNAIRARDWRLALQLVKDRDPPFLWTPDGTWFGGEQSVDLEPERQGWANEEMERQRKRIQELEAKEEYLENLLASANREINQQQKRIYELEDRSASADRTYLYWRGEALMLEKRLFELMENANRDRGEIERLNRMLLKALETLLLEE